MFSLFKTWKVDLPAGLVVFLIAVPLCLGIALASEAPLFSGLIAGIIGGIVVGLISGSSIGVSGPAAGLTAIVATAIHDLGSFELFLCCVVMAGFIQLILGVVRAGFISAFFPNVVIKGMLAAIGIIIILKQIPHALGYDKDPEGDENFFQPDGENTFSEIVKSFFETTAPTAMIITAVSIVILILWDKAFVQKTVLRFVPGPLVVVLLGIVFTLFFQGTTWELIADHRVDVGVSGKSVSELFIFPDFSQLGNSKVYIVAITLAVVASLETLLSVDASDKLDPEKRITPGNRELLAQGTGNIVSGLLGGLPLTQVVVRTSANVNAGGKSKLSTIIHGILIAVAVMSIPGAINFIPYASLAAILFMVGYKLAKPKIFLSVYKSGWLQFIPFMVTVVFVVTMDLLTGVAAGLAVSGLIAVIQRLTIKKVKKTKLVLIEEEEDSAYKLGFPDFTSFAKKAAMIKALNKVPENSSLKIDLSNVQILASDITETIDEFHGTAKTKNINVEIIPQNTIK